MRQKREQFSKWKDSLSTIMATQKVPKHRGKFSLKIECSCQETSIRQHDTERLDIKG